MNDETTGGAAFPTQIYAEDGMTLIDYFAAKAMAAIIAGREMSAHEVMTDQAPYTAKAAYAQAAAMLTERQKYM